MTEDTEMTRIKDNFTLRRLWHYEQVSIMLNDEPIIFLKINYDSYYRYRRFTFQDTGLEIVSTSRMYEDVMEVLEMIDEDNSWFMVQGKELTIVGEI